MLSTPDTQKLAKLLGMLGSTHDGEALSAARKAHQLVSRNGATWSDVIVAPDPDRDTTPTIEHHGIVLDLLKHVEQLTDFERRFLRGTLAFQKLTDKQAVTLETIKAKIASFEEGS
jgi:hypothetical protein